MSNMKSFLMALVAIASVGSLAGCVAYESPPPAGYYAPGPAYYAAPSASVYVGEGGGYHRGYRRW